MPANDDDDVWRGWVQLHYAGVSPLSIFNCIEQLWKVLQQQRQQVELNSLLGDLISPG